MSDLYNFVKAAEDLALLVESELFDEAPVDREQLSIALLTYFRAHARVFAENFEDEVFILRSS